MALGAFLGAIGTGIQIYGALQKGKAESKSAKAASKLSEKEAAYQKWKTNWELKQLEDYTKQLIGKQKVGFAKAGIEPLYGSALDVLEDTILRSQLDAEVIKKGGAINVERAKSQAGYFEDISQTATQLSLLEAGSTLLTEASRWKWWQ